jgi:hypothetical protein
MFVPARFASRNRAGFGLIFLRSSTRRADAIYGTAKIIKKNFAISDGAVLSF